MGSINRLEFFNDFLIPFLILLYGNCVGKPIADWASMGHAGNAVLNVRSRHCEGMIVDWVEFNSP